MTEQTQQRPQRRVVVGVDGSPGSAKALRWAVEQALLTGAVVEAVSAWHYPAMLGNPYATTSTMPDGDVLSTTTEKVLAETVAEVAGHQGGPVEVKTRVVQGHPAQVLLKAATGAQLLVVGSRGYGTFAGILLGSVGQHCVQHAPCPVVVIPR